MDIIKLFIRRPIFTSMLMVAVVVFGLFPGPILDLVQGPVTGILGHVSQGTALHLLPLAHLLP